MLTINTNLSSIIAQMSLNKSTNALNQAIERMSTGFKVNHSKDNAANYAIVNDMNSQISSLDVAEDNVSQGLDLINTADEMLGEINDRISRLRHLQVQASNGTYGKESLEAINAEVNALVDEVQRLYQNAEYNGIKLFMETEEDENGDHYYEQESFADEATTFEQLGLSATSFSVYDKDDNLIQTYDVEESDTLGDFLTTLTLEGFTARMDSGTVQIKSDDGKYIKGDLADSLGISTKETTYIQSTEQNFDNEIPVTTESSTVITETTTKTEEQITTETVPVTITEETTTTRTEQTTSIKTTETVIVEWSTTTTSTTSTSTIYETTTVETTTTTTTETIATVYTATTETLLVPATAAATLAVDDGVAAVSETSGFIEPITRRDTSTMTALSSMASNSTLTSGTYKISTTAELQQLATLQNSGYLSSSNTYEFVLADNIDLSSISNWTPIGNNLKRFYGTFDGNGYVISNLTIDRPDEDYVGLFGYSYGDIKNLGLENVNVKGRDYVGGLVGMASMTSMTTITNCYVLGDVSGTNNVGGLAGDVSGDITSCSVSGTVSGNRLVGGLVGITLGDITSCNVKCDVSGTEAVGGLAGNAARDITNSYVTGNVSGTDKVGGLAGNVSGDITSCSVSGTVSGDSNTGVLVGRAYVGLGEPITISSSSVLSQSTDIDGVFCGTIMSDMGDTLTIKDCTYNSYYDTAGIPLYTGETPTITNVTPIDVAPPTPTPTYTTATLDTTFAELGCTADSYGLMRLKFIGKPIYYVGVNWTIQYLKENMVGDIADGKLFTKIELIDGKLYFETVLGELDLTQGFLSELGATQTTSEETKTIETTQTIEVEKVTETPVTETIWTTTTSETTRTDTITETITYDTVITETIEVEKVTDSVVTTTTFITTTEETTRTEPIFTTNTVNVTGVTAFGVLGVDEPMRVTVYSEGTKEIVTIRANTTLDEFYAELLTKGITATSSGGVTTFTGQGNSYIDSRNLAEMLGLSAVSNTYGTKTSNTDSERQYSKEKIYGVYAPGEVTLQAGVNASAESRIAVDVAFSLRGINNLRGIGEDLTTDYLSILDEMLTEITDKQTDFGAFANRLESALEEISIRRDNLVSSRSTLRDADVAEVSSKYIQQQILQQASATLLSTANQTPAIALQLI